MLDLVLKRVKIKKIKNGFSLEHLTYKYIARC